MSISQLIRLWHTIRSLKAEQVFYRLYYVFGRRFVRWRAMRPLGRVVMRKWDASWSAPTALKQSHIRQGVFTFLGECGEVSGKADWNSPTKSKLWLYNLHYMDDLNAVDAERRSSLHEWLVGRWIEDNSPMCGNGWEPYPLALRIVNLVKYFSSGKAVSSNWIDSLARQSQALYAQEERHLLANHLFVDGKALVFAGVYFGGEAGERWLKRGLEILDEEANEQFLSDGGNFELSPMYHSSLVWDVCELVRLAQLSSHPALLSRVEAWKGVVGKGLEWLRDMSHPDGEISFFNDSAFGVAPALADLEGYARFLGLDLKKKVATGDTIELRHLASSGYIVASWKDDVRAILDVGEVGPTYQPGHAHADSLSFELSVYGERLLVNSGTSQYGEDAERQRQRGTEAHNTVMVDGLNSSDVWAGFRVGRRARPVGLTIRNEGTQWRVGCSHDGYAHLPGRVRHQREWVCSPKRLIVKDTIFGEFSSARSRLHLHPDVRLSRDGNLLLKSGRTVRFTLDGGVMTVQDSTWHPGFGVSIPNLCLEISFVGAEVSIEFEWD